MALDPRAVPIHRGEVAQWLNDFTGTTEQELRDYLTAKVDDVQEGMLVDTRLMNMPQDYTLVVDMIMDDLPSYGFEL